MMDEKGQRTINVKINCFIPGVGLFLVNDELIDFCMLGIHIWVKHAYISKIILNI